MKTISSLALIGLFLVGCGVADGEVAHVYPTLNAEQWGTVTAAAAATNQPYPPTPAAADYQTPTPLSVVGGLPPGGQYTPEVLAWWSDIERWTAEWRILDVDGNQDPHILATVMQVSTCGNQAWNRGGEYGLFGVTMDLFDVTVTNQMPDARVAGMMDVETNGDATARFLANARKQTNDIGMFFATWRGGWGVFSRSYDAWGNEAIRFQRAAVPLYGGARSGDGGIALAEWYAAAGQFICTN